MDSVKSKVLCIGAAAVTLSGGDGAADGDGCGDERVQQENMWKRTGFGTGHHMVGVRGGEEEKEEEKHVVVTGEKKGCATANEQEQHHLLALTTNAVAAANNAGVARRSGSSDREIGPLWNVVV